MLPEVPGQVVQLTADDTCDARKLAALINRDQAMAGNLMRLVNSPMYAGSVPIVSLQQAVGRLGLKKIREVALIISCQGKVFAVPGYDALVRSQFRHSLAAAGFAQEIARSRRWNVEEAFLCGLLHDVGRPALLQVLVDIHRSLGLVPVDEALFSAIRRLHATVGAELVKRWQLPVRLSDTILWHHDPLKSSTAAQTATMTALADDLAHWALSEIGTVRLRKVDEAALRSHPMLAVLNIYPEELDQILAARPRVLELVSTIG